MALVRVEGELFVAKAVKIPYDNNPKYKGVINYASNGVKDKKSAFEYGFC